jgi:hypothetical protein
MYEAFLSPLSVQTMPSRFDVDNDVDVEAGVDNVGGVDDEKLLQRFLMLNIGLLVSILLRYFLLVTDGATK